MHDEQCTNGNIVFQPKLDLQQTLPLLCLKPYKHPKETLTPPKKKTMARYCAIIFFLDKEKKVTMLCFFSFSQTQRR